ncbi:MAG: DUF1616 domain-containing protein [Candidatus Moranbacteria bacterium]|nr:DUF1616 domain-containing protein [Candidatus Moranbacteria bacterium]
MLNFIQSQILFYITLGFVLFLPGYFLLLAVFGKSQTLSALEKFVFSFGLSIVSVDFIFFLLDKLGISINRFSSIAAILIFSAICFAIYKFRKISKADREESHLFNFSRNQFILILLLLFLAVFLKTAYLSRSVLPSATDMGHHMYWVNSMVESGKLPIYDGLPDFIIGEHVIFGIIALISGASVFSAFPIAVLLLINIFSILTVFILTLRIFENKNVAILSLLFLGALYAISSPQAKFVSGGVIGNIMGNFLMPLAFYCHYRAFSFLKEEEMKISAEAKTFMALAVFVTFGLFYTHHLTAFIFLFVFALIAVGFLLVNYKEVEKILPKIGRVIFSPQVLIVSAACLIFFFYIFVPTYVKSSAVGTAVGVASKETRTGLSMDNLRSAVGEARLALGLVGIVLLLIFYKNKRRNLGYAIVAAWAIMVFVMSSYPKILFLNLPSSRIGNYLTYPIAILSAYAFYEIFKNKNINDLLRAGFFVILAFALVGGLADFTDSFKVKTNANELTQTFGASRYLAEPG